MHTTIEQQLAGIADDPCNPEHPISDIAAWVERHGGNPAAVLAARRSYRDPVDGIWHEGSRCQRRTSNSPLTLDAWDPLTTSIDTLCECAHRWNVGHSGHDNSPHILADLGLRDGLEKLDKLVRTRWGRTDKDLLNIVHVTRTLNDVFPGIVAHYTNWLNQNEAVLCRELHAIHAGADFAPGDGMIDDYGVTSLWDMSPATSIALANGVPVDKVVDRAAIDAALRRLTQSGQGWRQLHDWAATWTAPYDNALDSFPLFGDWLTCETTSRIWRQLTTNLTDWAAQEHDDVAAANNLWYLIDANDTTWVALRDHGFKGDTPGGWGTYLSDLLARNTITHDDTSLLLVRATAVAGYFTRRGWAAVADKPWVCEIDGPPDMNIVRTAASIHHDGRPVSDTYECARRLIIDT
jgi:hypothetical protein